MVASPSDVLAVGEQRLGFSKADLGEVLHKPVVHQVPKSLDTQSPNKSKSAWLKGSWCSVG